MRRTNFPSLWRAHIQLKRAVRALPTWIDPLGAGSMRVLTVKESFDEVEPVDVLLVAAVDDLRVTLLQRLGDRARLEETSVDLADRDDLGGAAGEEQLVRRVEVR